MIVPEPALVPRTLRGERSGDGLLANDGEVAVDQTDLTCVDIGLLYLLPWPEGKSSTEGSLEI